MLCKSEEECLADFYSPHENAVLFLIHNHSERSKMRVFGPVYFVLICGMCHAGVHDKIQDISNMGNRLSTLGTCTAKENEAREQGTGKENEQEDVAEKEKTNLKGEESTGEGISQLVLVTTLLLTPLVIMTI